MRPVITPLVQPSILQTVRGYFLKNAFQAEKRNKEFYANLFYKFDVFFKPADSDTGNNIKELKMKKFLNVLTLQLTKLDKYFFLKSV